MRPLLRLLCGVVALLVLVPVAASAVPVDPYATYDPQSTCSPAPKPGTLKLAAWLQRQYAGSGSLGISGSCKDGGVSEHKEGRAFDWAVSVHSARDRGYVADFLARIFATDADGNPHALARRMGIMYLIWDDHIYSSYYAFRARDYRGCAVLATCSDTLRHRNHVHISLSRDGGAGRTSWYTGASDTPTPTDTPVLDLSTTPSVSLDVKADGTPTTTPFRLAAGTTYDVTAAGLYGYGAPDQVADASCRWSDAARRWLSTPTAAVARSHGSLDLRADGTPVGGACQPGSHVYRTTLTPTTTHAVQLAVTNRRAGAGGTLRVVISAPGTDVTGALPTYPALAGPPTASAVRAGPPLTSETQRVSAAAAEGTWTTGSLQRGATYRISVGGTVGLGGGTATDGRCTRIGGRWYRHAALDRRVPAAAHGRLFVDGVRFDGRPASRRTATCATRSHVLTATATRTGRMQLAVWDPLTRADDTGSLTVTVRRVG